MTVQELLNRIDELQVQIDSFGELSGEIFKKIQYKFRLDWNYHSNALEGNSLTQQETRSVMINNITIEGKPLKDVMEVRGHDNVITDILKIGKGELRLSEKRIKEVHKAIMHEDELTKQNKIGQWKTENNHLINYKKEKFDFVQYSEVPQAMHELLNWLNNEYDKIKRLDKTALHPALLAFEFHLKYVNIHPFYDGNGRTARIFTNLILISFGFSPVIIKLNERNVYNQYLADIQAYGGSPDLFYEFMSKLLIRSQEIMMNAIQGKDIDEPDDLDKEIVLWKKQLKESESGVTLKSNQLLYDLYLNSIRPFFISYLEKMRQFDDVFDSKKITSWVNSTSDGQNTGLILIDKRFEEWKSVADIMTMGKSGKTIYFRIDNIGVNLELTGFKKDGVNTFNIANKIAIEFDQYVYRILHQGKKIGEYLYSDHVDLTSLANECLKVTFDTIKAKVKSK